MFFELLFVELLICLFCMTLSGIPGIGVGPFCNGLPRFFWSGMPGIGVVPFGTVLELAEFGSGIPGGIFVMGIGLAENPGGIFVLLTAFTFAFGVSVVEQAKFTANKKLTGTNKIFFNIKTNLPFKIAVPI